MARRGKKPPDEVAPQRTQELGPAEFFEIESLNADALDIEELEARLEMAASIADLGLYCGADCGSLCGVNCTNNCQANCPGNCVANCTTNCQADCGLNCQIDFCETDGCSTMAIP